MNKFKNAVVTIVLKNGVERKFTVSFAEPLDAESMEAFTDMIYGEVEDKKLNRLKLPINETQVVFLEYDEISFAQVTFF